MGIDSFQEAPALFPVQSSVTVPEWCVRFRPSSYSVFQDAIRVASYATSPPHLPPPLPHIPSLRPRCRDQPTHTDQSARVALCPICHTRSQSLTPCDTAPDRPPPAAPPPCHPFPRHVGSCCVVLSRHASPSAGCHLLSSAVIDCHRLASAASIAGRCFAAPVGLSRLRALLWV